MEAKKLSKKNKLGPYVRLLLPNRTIPATRTLIMGRSGTGKTTLAISIIKNYFVSHVNRFFVICPTFMKQTKFSALYPFVRVEDVYIERPEDEIFWDVRRKIDEDLTNNPNSRFLLFIDDVAADTSTNKGRKGAFASLAVEAPHDRLSIVAIFQQATTCSASFRNNTDNVIVFSPADQYAVDIFQKEFNPYLFDKSLAKRFYDKAVEVWIDGDFVFIHRPARNEVCAFRNFDSLIKI